MMQEPKYSSKRTVPIRKNIDNTETVIISSNRLEECISYINSNNIQDIDINLVYYKSADISFLDRCPNITKLYLDHPFVKDISVIYKFNQLKELGFGETKHTIDLSAFPSLTSLSLEWNKKHIGLETLVSLENLGLYGYSSKSGDLQELSSLKKLKSLTLTKSPIESLKGIENFQQLEALYLFYLRKLSNLEGLGQLDRSVKKMEVECCKRMEDLDPIGNLTNLEYLILSGCGEIPSISFAAQLSKLHHFTFPGTTVMDGDMSPCCNIDYVYFTNKKFYSHKLKDFQVNS